MQILNTQPSVAGPPEWFTGVVHFDVIAPGTESEGIALTQSRGGDVVVLHAGDTVWCPPGEWHWHGAAPDRFMTHLAIWDGLADGQDGPETEWGTLVTDAEYSQPPA
jgi:hypothetical protein